MRIILRTIDLPAKSAALYRPRKSPIGYHRSCEKMMREKTPLLKRICVLSGKKCFIIFSEKLNYLILKIYATSEEAVSHNVLYYQQLSNARN